MFASGLIVPETPKLVFPKPAIVKAENLELSKHMLLGMPLTLGMLPGKKLPFDLTYRDSYGTATDATSYNAGTLSFGPAAATGHTRYILVCTHGCVNTTAGRINSVTIAGTAATRLYFRSDSEGRPTEIWYIQNNNSTSGTVSAVTSTTGASFGLSVWTLTNPLSITPTFTNSAGASSSTTNSVSITVPDGGAGVCLYSTNFNSGTSSWTNATEQYEVTQQSGQTSSGAKATTVGTYTVTATSAGAQNTTLVVACWSSL